VSNERKPKLGRPALPPHLRKQHVKLFAIVSPDFASKVQAEAERRGCSYSHLVRTFVSAGMAAIAEQRAA
jgi:hypothetical protein